MQWSLKELINLKDCLEKLETKDKIQKQQIEKEILVLIEMIKSITCTSIKSAEKIYIDVTEETQKVKCDFFEKVLSDITLYSSVIEKAKRLPMYWFTNNRISQKEFYILVEGFLNEFKFDLKNIYEEMKKNSQINISTRNFFDALGICYYFPSVKKNYIDVTFEETFKNCEVLPHELGHAYLFDKIDSTQKYNMFTSSLGEAFPMFIQLAFYDYLKKTKYFKNAINRERTFFDNLGSYYELNSGSFINSKKVYFDNNCFFNENNEPIFEKRASAYLSGLLACYFNYLYRNNEINEIEKFNQMYKNGKEYEYYKGINANLILKVLNEEFRSFCKSFKEYKTLVKNK